MKKEIRSKYSNRAFSLAEMMVVMLILSIILVASMPIITKKASASPSAGIWQYVPSGPGANSNIYYGTGNTQSAAIGTNSFVGSDNARLLLNTSSASQNQILFKQGNTETGKLIIDGNHNVGLGEVALASTSGSCATALGYNAIAISAQATALGTFANASGLYGTALGVWSHASNQAATAIGQSANASGQYSIAIGQSANASGQYSIALGQGTNASGEGSIAIGADSAGNSAYSTTANQIMLGTSSHQIYAPGTLKVGSFTTGGSALYQNGGVLSTSDFRLKNVNGEFNEGLYKIKQIKTYNYTFKQDKKKTPHVGIIAQDLRKIFPNAVTKDDEGFLMARQDDMFYAMINSIKELDKIVQSLVKNVKSIIVHINQIDDEIVALIKTEQIVNKKIEVLEAKNKQLEVRNKLFEIRLKKLEGYMGDKWSK